MLTKQQVFSKVKAALLKQNAKSLAATHASAGQQCCYFAEDESGYKCAVGHIIPDELQEFIKDRYNETSLRQLVNTMSNDFTRFVDRNLAFLRDLQVIHDVAPISDWPAEFAALATKYELDNV